MAYDDKSPWPTEADGEGYSLVSKEENPTGDPNDPSYWRLSSELNGSPGSDDLITTVGAIKNDHYPLEFRLYQNYPNPFNPTTKIQFKIPHSSYISLKIYNVLGQEVATLVEGYKNRGSYEVTFDGSGLASGIYLYRLKTSDLDLTKKLILLK